MNGKKFLSAVAILLIGIGSANFPVKAQINSINSARQIDFTLKTQNDQTFNQLIQQAEIQAISLIEQEFASNPSVAEIAVTVLGDRQGQQAPLLFSKVSRTDWQQQPIIRQWTKYFATSAVLLGFNSPQTTPTAPAQSTPSTPIQSAPIPSSVNNAVPMNVVPPTPPSPSSNNAPAPTGGASLEETDPGYR